MANNYKQMLKLKIQELEMQIEQSTERRAELQIELNKLKLIEFEEDLREDGMGHQQLLKG
jgi:hypothetical protein